MRIYVANRLVIEHIAVYVAWLFVVVVVVVSSGGGCGIGCFLVLITDKFDANILVHFWTLFCLSFYRKCFKKVVV